MFKKLGFALPHTERSHLAYILFRQINAAVLEDSQIAPTIFAEELTRHCVAPSCPIMNLIDIWGYDGTVVATNFATAQILADAPGPKKKIFYVWDLEWLRQQHQNTQYSALHNIYHHPRLEIVARADTHKTILQNNFNVGDIRVIKDAKLEEFLC